MKIVSVAEMRALEHKAFAAGVSEAELQARAGAAIAEEVFKIWRGGRIVVLVGHGNNGRDGGVAAEWLLHHGVEVDLVLAPRHALTPEELARLRALGATTSGSPEDALRGASVAVDALVGIGANGALREPLSGIAAQLNAARSNVHVVALDIPSGIDADTGEVPGEAVSADTTVTLGAVKQGLLRFPGAERVGRLIPRSIGLTDDGLQFGIIDDQLLAPLLPERPPNAHKYRFGRVLVIAGTDHFLGAPVLCAGGAARVGAGLITVHSTRDVRLNVAAHLPEVTFTDPDVAFDSYLTSHDAVVIGPGLGRGAKVTEFVRGVLVQRSREHALVVDADGLFALSEMQDWPVSLGENAVITPHSGELERLVGHPLGENEPLWVQAGRLASGWGCTLVAKGPFTCVAGPDGRVDVWPHANAALATGGTGDVLAGVTAGLLAQGLRPWDAARLAVGVHASAAAKIMRRGWRTLVASDLFEEIPSALDELSQPRLRRSSIRRRRTRPGARWRHTAAG
jgi:ADP-dependent NAD(P)H-hydrate dehydratase / NAD(P)H-hydrate epimerase